MDEFENSSLSERCVKWDEVEGVANGVLATVSVDEYGFFLFWKVSCGSAEVLEISTIRDIRIGNFTKTPSDRKVLDLCEALSDETYNISERCISICSGPDFVNLGWVHLVSKTNEFSKNLHQMIISRIQSPDSRNPSHLNHLRKLWFKIQLNLPDSIDTDFIMKLFSQNKEDDEKLQDALSYAGLTSKTIKKFQFSFDCFLDIYESLFMRDMLSKVYNDVATEEAHSKNKINSLEFSKFINQYQRDKRLNEILFPQLSEDKVKEIILRFENNPVLSEKGCISSKGISRFLYSEENSIFGTSCYCLNQDMNQPLNHYFINSSHNTYLTGHQLTGKSSAEIYRQILLSGCRCIELDIWDGKGLDDEPIVTHGFTMCTAVPLKDVIDAISESAFKTSEYPVILSFENHCTSKQLPILVSIIREKLGDKILQDVLESNPLEPDVPLPSPEQLKRKILIKNKKKAQPKETEANATEDDDDKAADVLIPEISTMVNYIEPTSFESFDKAKEKNVSFECCSVGEVYAMQLMNENPVDFVNFNKRQMSRIYPKGTRVDSSNYLPQLFWNVGCQLVALNFQTLDFGMQLNLATFEVQNRCGYLLKPLEMRARDKEFDPFLESGVNGVVANSLKVMVLSGQFISDKISHCFVDLEMYGLPADTVRKTNRVKSTTKNGLNPQFPRSFISFKKIIHPQLAMLRLVISNEQSKFIGQSWIFVDQIKPGYRFVNIKNESGQHLLMSSLLLYIEIEDYVPCDMEDFASALSNPIAFMTAKERRTHQLEILTEDFVNEFEDENFDQATVKSKESIQINKSTVDISTKTPTTVQPIKESKKKQTTLKLKASLKKKSSIKRGKSVRGNTENDEIMEFVNQSILKDPLLTDISLEKMKGYKRISKITEKKDKLVTSVKKKYNKKRLLLLSDSKDISTKRSIKYKQRKQPEAANEENCEDSECENDEDIQIKLSQLDANKKEILVQIDQASTNEIHLVSQKYTTMFYEELHLVLENEIMTTRKRLEKIYQKETEVMKSLQHYKFKCEIKSLQKECTNKDEFSRLKRESTQKHVQSSVYELQKLTELKEKRSNELEDIILKLSNEFKNEKDDTLALSFCGVTI